MIPNSSDPVSSQNFMYHATKKELAPSILDEGLLPSKPSQWSDHADTGYVYMGENPRECISWMQNMWAKQNEDQVDPDLYDVVLFKIDTGGLDLEHDVGRNWKYKGAIEPDRLVIHSSYSPIKTSANSIRLKHLVTPEEALTYKDYRRILSAIESGKTVETADIFAPIFAKFKDIVETIANDFKISVAQLIEAFKQKDMFKLLKAIGFNLWHLLKAVHAASDLLKHSLMTVIHEISESKIVQQIRKGAVKVDELLNKYPILKKITGLAMAGILLYMWINMSFIGNAHYDLNLSDVVAAFVGRYSIAELFTSDAGLLFVSLFGIGFSGLSFPWLGTKLANLLAAMTYTLFLKLKNHPDTVRKLRLLMPMKHVAGVT